MVMQVLQNFKKGIGANRLKHHLAGRGGNMIHYSNVPSNVCDYYRRELDRIVTRKKYIQRDNLRREEVAREGNVVHDINDDEDEVLQRVLDLSREEEAYVRRVRDQGGQYEHGGGSSQSQGGGLLDDPAATSVPPSTTVHFIGAKQAASLRAKGEKVGQKRKQHGNETGSDLDMKTKKAEEEFAETEARANAPSDDLSIKMCISVLKTMEELSSEEKVESFEVFKNVQDREIFLCAGPAERLLWIRRKIETQTGIGYGQLC
ncbi:hypothetical protein PR202_ga22940 [Eleusine coracana subsp. coracana]|uniref:Uncharacterized protein n=1 Tax=Eleusine coracana subsp. coracana TaxID=191504 RepID=A0AAV5D4D8_ELECO|nr:hypothetical protein PR202_ga22940 [Eleusine coracana subsp. coracana]